MMFLTLLIALLIGLSVFTYLAIFTNEPPEVPFDH